jgi:hypothetical protein
MKTRNQTELTPSVAPRRNLTARTAVASLAIATASILVPSFSARRITRMGYGFLT